MRILINGWFWGQTHTGSGQYLHRLAEQLAQETTPAAFTLLLPGTEDWGMGSGDWGVGTGDRGLGTGEWESRSPIPSLCSPLPALPRPLAKLYWEQIAVPLAARRLGADLLFVPYWAAPLWQPAPTVVTVHDLIPLLLPLYRGGLLNRLYTRLVSLGAARCAAVITVSRAGAQDLIAHLRIPVSRVFPIHHGPNVESPTAPDARTAAAVRTKYNLPERYFLYLGGFDARKNVEGILAGYRRYLDKGGDPAVKLVLAGQLPGQDSPFFPDPVRMASALNLTDHLHFTGWVDEADKPQLYAGATAYLFPSRYEGFGMMLLEAMAAGCPVVTSR